MRRALLVVLVVCLWTSSARADRRAEAKRHFKTGMALIDEATFKGVLLQHYPQLEEAGLRNVENAFEPWGTTALEHPEEHPLAAIVKY